MSNGDARWCCGGKPARSRFSRSLVIISYARGKINAPQNLFLKAEKQFSWFSPMRKEKHQQWVAWAGDFLLSSEIKWIETECGRDFGVCFHFSRIFETSLWSESSLMMCTCQQVDLFSCLINYNGTWYSHIVPETVILRSKEIWFICLAFISEMSLQTKRTMACWKYFLLLCGDNDEEEREKKLHDSSFDVNNIKASCREAKPLMQIDQTNSNNNRGTSGRKNQFSIFLLTPATVGFSFSRLDMYIKVLRMQKPPKATKRSFAVENNWKLSRQSSGCCVRSCQTWRLKSKAENAKLMTKL